MTCYCLSIIGCKSAHRQIDEIDRVLGFTFVGIPRYREQVEFHAYYFRPIAGIVLWKYVVFIPCNLSYASSYKLPFYLMAFLPRDHTCIW